MRTIYNLLIRLIKIIILPITIITYLRTIKSEVSEVKSLILDLKERLPADIIDNLITIDQIKNK